MAASHAVASSDSAMKSIPLLWHGPSLMVAAHTAERHPEEERGAQLLAARQSPGRRGQPIGHSGKSHLPCSALVSFHAALCATL